MSEYKPQDLINLAEKSGMEFQRKKGSHAFYEDPKTGVGTTIPIHDVVKGGTAEGNILPTIALNARLRNANIYKETSDKHVQEFLEKYHAKAKENPLNWIPEDNRRYTDNNGVAHDITNGAEAAEYIKSHILYPNKSYQKQNNYARRQ